MYKLLIVEDEDMLRDALINSIDWAKRGYEVRGAEDGRDALRIAHEFLPDIVLTDVRMPFMDGVQLSAALREAFPGTIVAILSGHDEFQVAQQALKIGVKEYVTKPIRPADLIELVERMTKTFSANQMRERQLAQMREQLEISLPLLRKRLLNRMMEQPIDEAELLDLLNFVGLKLKGESFTVCVIEFESLAAPREAALLECAASDLVQREVNTDAVAFELYRDGVALIYCARTKDIQRERDFIRQLLLAVTESLQDELGISATVGIGTPVTSLVALHNSYDDALEALRMRVLSGKNQIYDVFERTTQTASYPFEELKLLLSRLRLGKSREWEEAIAGFFEMLRQQGAISLEQLRVLMIELAVAIDRLLIESGSAPDTSLDTFYKALFSLDTLDEYCELVTKKLLHARDLLEEARGDGGGALIENVCAYIQDHFQAPDMSLISVAKSVFISPTYLSILFKKKLGITFSDYVITLRIEKAKELLRISSLRTYEVAARTGYNDPQYFSGCFKKYTGHTPTEYRSLHQGDAGGKK